MERNNPYEALRITEKNNLRKEKKIALAKIGEWTADFALAIREGRVHGICMD